MKFRMILVSLAVSAGLVVAPRSAAAGVPDPAASTWPRSARVVGTDANGVPDPLGTMHFQVYSHGNPAPNVQMILDLTDATGIRLCNNGALNYTIECFGDQGPYVRAFTGPNGILDLTILGRAHRADGGSNAPSVKIYADGVLFGTIPLAAFDQDGGGLGAADNVLWQADYFSGQYWERSDLDGDGVLGPSDLSAWLTAFFAAGSLQTCVGATCP